ncbi:hypothetical protein QYE76_033278 [Lolium multiflorum]|uniref:Uncharacterized protein n=1 Tax=Lolium multiflorum TaxID=4521 RepID=A0AAD8VLZ4_LOLMU|nr:hypothetical protein QYE76_033278 [Lolium multiflorum]
MAPPPKPPPGYFEWGASVTATNTTNATTQASTSLVLAPSSSTLSYNDTIANDHLGRSHLCGHVAADSVPRPNDPQWVKDDLAIIQWIYTRVSTEIFNLVFRNTTTASALCDTSMSTYFQRLNTIADELRELGDPVAARQLINILVAGLSERFEK